MKFPPHPGRLIRSACLAPFGLATAEAAKVLGVAETELDNLLEGRLALSPEMAIRLEAAFGGTADSWVRLQAAHDLARARSRAGSLRISRYRG